MKSKFVTFAAAALLVPAVFAWSAACSRKPENPAAGTPTPAPAATPATTATPTPAPAGPPRIVYVALQTKGLVSAYDMTGAPAAGFTPITTVSQPSGLAVDAASHTLYVLDRHKNELRTFDAATGAEKPLRITSDAGLDVPYAMTLAGGVLYFANSHGSNILAFDAATGKPVTSGFTSPPDRSTPETVAVRGGTLYTNSSRPDGSGDFVDAFNLATGVAVPGFTPIKVGSANPVLVSGDMLFIYDTATDKLGEYDATTGAVINAEFPTGCDTVHGLALLGRSLFVGNLFGDDIRRIELPDKPTPGNQPVSVNPKLIPDVMSGADALAVSP